MKRSMSKLNATIQSLAATFASEVITALRGLSLDEILAVSGKPTVQAKRPGRRAASAPPAAKTSKRLTRRTPADIEKVTTQIVALLKQHKDGLRAEQIQVALNLAKNESPRPIADALAKKLIRKTGQKRSTTYFAR
jgi:hypothetical protein